VCANRISRLHSAMALSSNACLRGSTPSTARVNKDRNSG
jgi:hypothetical protein